MAANLTCDKFWVNKCMYHDAEKKFYENKAKLQKTGQFPLETLGRKNEETSSHKMKDIRKSQLKYNKNMPDQLDIDALKEVLTNLSAKNVKKEDFHNQRKLNRSNNYEIIKQKHVSNCIKIDGIVDSEDKLKPKELIGKKSKSEKKSKRMKGKGDNALGGVGVAKLNQDTFPKTSLSGEVAKALQHIKSSLECMDQSVNGAGNFRKNDLYEMIENLTKRVEALEKKCTCSCTPPPRLAVCPAKPQTPASKPSAPAKPSKEDDDDDVDLFGSDSEEEDEESKKIREQRLAEYAAKKSKKPALVAKSNIILDIKPWDDETDMKEMEKAVRAIEMDGLVWGASKLVPVAFKIFKLQISCVIEDDKVSVDVLTETLEGIEDYIQSVDIAAFNKV